MEIVLDDKTATRRIAANLRRRLDELAMTQQELADKSRNSKMHISHIVRGMYVPNVVALARIAEVIGITVDDLIADPRAKSN